MVMIESITAYIWLRYNDNYDCTAGIVVDGTPASVGVFISTKRVLTSANPLNNIDSDPSRVTVKAITRLYNESYEISVIGILNNLSQRNKNWVPMGVEATKHSSIHDLAVLYISDEIFPTIGPAYLRKSYISRARGRRPYPVHLPNITAYELPTEFSYGAFGFMDEDHVQNNTALEVAYYTSGTIADCDEWIPREWGRFICILDEENSYTLASGSPLFQERDMTRVFGIGCFSLTKGKEKLHVFTDLKPYVSGYSGFI